MAISPDFEKLLEGKLETLVLDAYDLNKSPLDPAVDYQDIAQDACERAIRFNGTFIPGTNFEGWMTRILWSAHINNYRRTRHRARTESIEASVETDRGRITNLQQQAEKNATAPSVEVIMEARIQREEIWKQLGEMNQNQRGAIIAVDILGLSYNEAADALQVKRVTFGPRLHKARKALAKRLGPDFRRS